VIDPGKAALFIPPGLVKFKADLFERIGKKIGTIVRNDYDKLARLPDELIPVVGCTPELRPLIDQWRKTGRQWIYWDRGYARRVFATWLPKGDNGGYYRWHYGSFQMSRIRPVPDDRWRALKTEVRPWSKSGDHIVLAAPTKTYMRFHRIESWVDDTLDVLARITRRQVVIRHKEFKRPLQDDLTKAHCLVAHGSNAAVEAVICGCPVFVHPDSAAALVGRTNLDLIEQPIYPEREAWLRSLAYSQFSETELVDGTLWRLMDAGGDS
jgi:hypothetical protein